MRRRQDLALADHEDVLARALADQAPVVEEDRLVVARVGALGLGEDRVQVLAGCLRVRDQADGEIRRQEETFARIPFRLPSSPR